MHSSSFQFRQVRTFDEVLSISFRFIRVHARPLGKSLGVIAGVYLLLAALVLGAGSLTGNALLESIAFLLSSLIPPLVYTIVCRYITLYMRYPDRTLPVQDLWQASYPFLGKVLVGNILYTLGIGLGMIFLIIPGIYISVALAFIPIILVAEHYTVRGAIEHSMEVVKGQWWQTFGILAVTILVLLPLQIAFALPQLLLENSYMVLFNTMGAGPATVVYMAINILSDAGSVVASAMLVTVTSFQYFNLVERKGAAGLRKRISDMAEPQQNTDGTGTSLPAV